MIFPGKSDNAIKISLPSNPRTIDAALKMMSEDNKILDGDTLIDLITHQYASHNHNHANTIQKLYSDEIVLRQAIIEIASSYEYSEHQKPQIDSFPLLIDFCVKVLSDSPWKQSFNWQTDNYDPTKYSSELSVLYNHLKEYDIHREMIDREWELPVNQNGLLDGVEKGDPNFDTVITSPEIYKLAAHSWFTRKAELIKNTIDAGCSPADALQILLKYWEFYITPTIFKKMNETLIYCVSCAETITDTSSTRKEFREVVRKMTP